MVQRRTITAFFLAVSCAISACREDSVRRNHRAGLTARDSGHFAGFGGGPLYLYSAAALGVVSAGDSTGRHPARADVCRGARCGVGLCYLAAFAAILLAGP